MESGGLSGQKINFPKIIVILGPTSSGKSDVAIQLAQKFNGEIISADSRQVFKWLDIGSGKITPEEQKMVPHHLLDVVHPNDQFNASHFKKETDKIIANILIRKKNPILCGGTGFWIKSVVDNITYPKVKPNLKLREELEEKTTEELFEMLQKYDPERSKNIDAKNKIRLIRAIEICQTLGKVPKKQANPQYQTLQIGISWPKEKLNERIETRLKDRFALGMIQEVEQLHEKYGITWKRIEEFGLGYLWIAKYFQGEIKKDEIFEKVYQAEKNYAKRQMTWFQKDKRIIWLEKYADIEKEVGKFLS